MNERIKELYEQAHEQKPTIVIDPVTFEPIHKIDDYNKPMYHKVFNPEKFAELIVRECAQKGFNVFDEEPDAPASDLQYYVRDGIKKHFGVEE